MNTPVTEWLNREDVKTRLTPVRELQGVLLEMLQVFDGVCTRLGLHYYLFYGTLLGAIRHHGFIPWDDDADVVMPRADYERLLREGAKFLPKGYFLQWYGSEPDYRHPFAKLRKDGTACIIPEHSHIRMHAGIFVDIFPLDEAPKSRIGQWLLWHIPYGFERLCAFSVARLPFKLRWMSPCQRLWQRCFRASLWAKWGNCLACWLSGNSGSYVSTFITIRNGLKRAMDAKFDFEPARRIDFSGITLSIPANAERVLQNRYGDYLKPPSDENRIQTHASSGVISTTQDYHEFLPLLYPEFRGDKRRNVITYGTFDLFHIGHLRLLERAKELARGGKLIVGISTDEFNWNSKRKRCAIPYEHRARIVAALKCVDEVFPETCWEQKEEDIRRYGIELFIMGDDWQGKFDSLRKVCEVIYLERTQGISSTQIKDELQVNGQSK